MHVRLTFTWHKEFKSNSFTVDIRCDNLSAPANGQITSCSSGTIGVGYEGDTCSFTCNIGYELTGSDTRTCQSDGSWSSTDTMCTRGIATYSSVIIVAMCVYVYSEYNSNLLNSLISITLFINILSEKWSQYFLIRYMYFIHIYICYICIV